MDDSDYVCPLCCEELDISDRQFFPCKCGYQVCMWCWHRIRESESGLCPACRTPYGDDPHEFSAVDVEEVLKANKEKEAAAKRERDRLRQQNDGGGSSDGDGIAALTGGNLRGQMDVPKDRTQLANMRVIRRNLVYAVGLPPSIASEDTLRKPEYLGQYGKISKIVINRSQTTSGGDPRRASASAYVTFVHKEDTLACILALDGFYVEGRNVRASYGTSKYCSAFIKNVRCNNPECTYLHQMGDVEDTFTKQEIQAGYVTSGRDVLARQQQIVAQALSASSVASGIPPRRKAGGGGPSGTGRSSLSPVFPAPTYDEPSKPPSSTLVPPPNAISARALTTGSGFPTISAANASQASVTSAPSQNKIVRSSSAGRLASAANSTGILGSTPKGSIGTTIQASRKTSLGAPGLGASSPATMTAPPGATAASVVAGAHSISRGTETPAPHTTLTPLTPLKRSNATKSSSRSSAVSGTDANADLNMVFPKGLTSERTSFVEQRRETSATNARQQTEMTTKLTSLRGIAGKRQNGMRQGGSAPASPSSEDSGRGATLSVKHLNATHADSSVSLIGGAVIAAPGVSGAGSIGTALGSIERGVLGDASVAGSYVDVERDVLGGLGGEVFDGPLKSSGSIAAVGSGAAIGSRKSKWNSTPVGGDPVFSVNPNGLWVNGTASSSTSSHGLGPSSSINPVAGGAMDATSTGAPASHTSGSSALASMLGINLPTGSGSLRESSNLWGGPAPSVQPPIAALNGTSVPVQGVIGPSVTNIGLIGGVTIGGGHPPMGVGGVGNGGNKNDIALLQSLLPGVHITSGNNHQPGGAFGAIGGGGWGNAPAPTQHQHQVGSGGLRVGDSQQSGHWGGNLQSSVGGSQVGAIGQTGTQQSQRQAPGSIW